MLRNRTAAIFLLVLITAVLLAGTWHLMAMRFRSGDVYPPYSSLRTDPKGCKALFDTLEHLPSITVRRHYAGIEDLDSQLGSTVFILGIRPYGLRNMGQRIDRLAAGGTHVVVSIEKQYLGHWESNGKIRKDTPDKDIPWEPEPENEPDADEKKQGAWDFEIKISTTEPNDKSKYEASLALKTTDLPLRISLTSPVYFDTSQDKWREIYTFEDGPVMVQRTIGQGKVTLMTGSYPVSNEALKWELHPDFLSWLLSDAGDVVFMESHLGVLEAKGLMTLVRKYRLTALLFSFALIAMLAVWKNAIPLVPFSGEVDLGSAHFISEKDQFSGFVSLLKRNISPGNIIRICYEEFEKSSRAKPARSGDFKGSLKNIPDHYVRSDDPVKAYNRITQNLSERKRG